MKIFILLLIFFAFDNRGLIPEQDIKVLLLWKKKIDYIFFDNPPQKAKVTVSSCRGKAERYNASNLIDDNKETYWATDDDVLSVGDICRVMGSIGLLSNR